MRLVKLICPILILSLILLMGCDKETDSSTLRNDKYEIYYVTNNEIASERLKTIMYNLKDTLNPVERFKIVHISDLHLSEWSSDNQYKYPNNLIEAVKFSNQSDLKINTLVATGDFVGNTHKTTKEEGEMYLVSAMYHLYNQNHIPTFICTGNHDSNFLPQINSLSIPKEKLYQILSKKEYYNLKKPTGENYYYSDIIASSGKIFRFIALDMLDQDSFIYDTQHYAIFSQKQIDWLCHTALKKDLSDKHCIIILTHYPLQPYSSKGLTLLYDGDFVHSWYMIPEIIEAFRKKEAIQKTYENKFIKDASIQVNANFSSIPGEFICYLGGHDHFTTHFEIGGLSNESKILRKQNMLLCTNMSPSEIGSVYNQVIRESNTISNNSFCLYSIDVQERIIYITFFGAYKPTNKKDYPDIQMVQY